MGESVYTRSIDEWSVGCILLELTMGTRVFLCVYGYVYFYVCKRETDCVCTAIYNRNSGR